MDQQTPFQPLQQVEQPRKKSVVIIVILLFIAFCAFSLAGIFFTTFGMKLLNGIFPTTARTLQISNSVVGVTKDHNIKIQLTDKETTQTMVDGFIIYPDNYQFTVIYPYTVSSSTVTNQDSTAREIRKISNAIYVQDPYDGTYHSIENGQVSKEYTDNLGKINPQEILKFISSYSKDTTVKNVSDGIELYIKSAHVSDEIQKILNLKIPNSDMTVVIDPKTYYVKSVTIKNESNINLSFDSFNTNKNIEAPSSINEFGDYISRESILLRTDKNGTKDYLWNAWEKKYYNCTHCVNKFWKDSNDSLLNVQKFVLGLKPDNILSSKVPDTYNEFLKLYKNSDRDFPENYSKSVKEIIIDPTHEIYPNPKKEKRFTNNAQLRDAVTILPQIIVPRDLRFLKFDYILRGNDDLSGRFQVFFENNLIFDEKPKIKAGVKEIDINKITPDMIQHASVPISKFAGKKGELYFTFVSEGRSGGEFLVNPDSIIFSKN